MSGRISLENGYKVEVETSTDTIELKSGKRITIEGGTTIRVIGKINRALVSWLRDTDPSVIVHEDPMFESYVETSRADLVTIIDWLNGNVGSEPSTRGGFGARGGL